MRVAREAGTRVLACAAPRPGPSDIRGSRLLERRGQDFQPAFDPGLDPRLGHRRRDLARDDLIEATGAVDKILGGGRYQITLESGQVVTAQLSGRMRRFRIRVIPGDRVTVGLSPYDPTHGFITFRLREGQ